MTLACDRQALPVDCVRLVDCLPWLTDTTGARDKWKEGQTLNIGARYDRRK
jgi:hypothetical protein